MYRIIDKRCSGKTSRLMLLAKENNGIIACACPAIMKEKALNYGITGVDFISYGDLIKSQGKEKRNIYIDEIEMFVKYCIQYQYSLKGYTLSNED